MARRRDIPWGLWLGCLAAALLAHAALIVPGGHALARSLGQGFAPRTSERAAFELELIEPDASESLQFVPDNQANGRRPIDAARIAEHDADVEEESAAPSIPAAPSGGRSGASKPVQQPAEPQPEPASTPAPLVAADDGRLADTQLADTQPTAVDPSEQWRLLAGSPNVLSENFAAPRPPATMPNAEPASPRLLDSRAHLHAAFYARMHERILEHYDCEAAIVRHDPQRIQLGDHLHSTVLRVELDRSGAIERLSFVRESDVEYLDAEAVRAIRAAGPFPNPPDELFDDDGTLVIRVAFEVNPDGSARVDKPR